MERLKKMFSAIRTKIIGLSVLPVLFIAGISSIAIINIVISQIRTTMAEGLVSTAVILAENMVAQLENGELPTINEDGALEESEQEVTYNLSDNALLRMKKETQMDYTVIYNGTYVVSTSEPELIGEPFDIMDDLLELLDENNRYVNLNTEIEGVKYMTVYQAVTYDDNVVGVVICEQRKDILREKLDDAISLYLIVLLIVCVIFITSAVGFGILLTNVVKKVLSYINTLSKGELNIEIEDELLKRHDELGDVARGVNNLKHSMINIIAQIKNSSLSLVEHTESLRAIVEITNANISQVEVAVSEVSNGATQQATETQMANEEMIHMGHNMDKTNEYSSTLQVAAKESNESNIHGMEALKTLVDANINTKNEIASIEDKINNTNSATKEIQQAVSLITSIASQTKLLSLNASIEAANAGEAGRGFAVVAKEIGKLAEQSNNSAKVIIDKVNELLEFSNQTVDSISTIKSVIDTQDKTMEQTNKLFQELSDKNQTMFSDIQQITGAIQELSNSKANIQLVIENLSAISEENAASTEETSASLTEITSGFGQVVVSIEDLNEMADALKKSIEIFTLD